MPHIKKHKYSPLTITNLTLPSRKFSRAKGIGIKSTGVSYIPKAQSLPRINNRSKYQPHVGAKQHSKIINYNVNQLLK